MEKVKTGIHGLDEITEGGFPRNRSIMVAGGPGSGKTTLCMQFLCNGARLYNENGIYVALSETPESIVENLSQYNFGIDELVKEKKLTFLDLSINSIWKSQFFTTGKADIELLSKTIKKIKEETDAKRIVFDSITAMMIALNTNEMREKLAMFANLSSDLEATMLMISEVPTGKKTISMFGIEEFVVDGIVILHNIQEKDTRVRGIEILKMRGVKHGQRIYPIAFTENGIEVYPEGRIFEQF